MKNFREWKKSVHIEPVSVCGEEAPRWYRVSDRDGVKPEAATSKFGAWLIALRHYLK